MLRSLRPTGVLSALSAPRAATTIGVRFSSRAAFTPLDLAFDVVEPKDRTITDQNMIICHGLFGSKQNWRSMAKAFAQKLGMTVYTLDMRNHGMSPSAKPHSYEAMAADISQFINKQGLSGTGINLLGHSMGGKAVMAFALNEELNKPLRTLVSVDMAPAIGKVSPDFMNYVECMRDVDRAKVSTRAEADKILERVEPEAAVRQFLLTNTYTESEDGKTFLRFRLPLDLLAEEIPLIGDFPYTPPPPVSATSPQWMGPTLFIKGGKSKYINRRNIPVCEAFFPNAKVETLDAGHWVHAEQPAETVEVVAKLINDAK